MREQFEKLPEIAERLNHGGVYWDGEKYTTRPFMSGFISTAIFLNGAYYAFQEQQQKIDKISEVVNGFRNAALIFDTEYNEGAYRVCEMILDEIEDY